jgi:hypothetical protein
VREGAGGGAEAGGRTLAHVDAPGIGADWELGDREVEILAAIDAAESVGAAGRALAERTAATLDEVVALARGALVRGVLTPDTAG